jgi:hypothetical protein
MAHDEHRLPETSLELRSPETRPYFLWWTTNTVGEFKQFLSDSDPERRAY